MSQNDSDVVAIVLGSVFRDKSAGYVCTLEQRQKSGGLGPQSALRHDENDDRQIGLASGPGINGCRYF